MHQLLVGAALLLLWGGLARALSSEWSTNPQYSYGWFVPFFTAYIWWLRWEFRPSPIPPAQSRNTIVYGASVALTLILLLPLRLFETVVPDRRLFFWLHALIVAALTAFMLWRKGGMPWLRHFLFPICFFLVAVPWPSAPENFAVESLMRHIAAIAAEAITLLGIPAQVAGNLIHLNTGTVGVNEACSGVRSLQTSLMIGILFGELKMLSTRRRLALAAAAVLVAVIGNLGRTFILVWLAATGGVEVSERWHDTAGYSILIAVSVTSISLAAWFGRSSRSAAPVQSAAPAMAAKRRLDSGIVAVLCWLFAIELGVELWFSHELNRSSILQWTIRWPNEEPGFTFVPVEDQQRSILRFDNAGSGRWQIELPDGARGQAVLYYFRWLPGSVSLLHPRSHRPDTCLPAAGWHQTADFGLRNYRVAHGIDLPFQHVALSSDLPQRPRVFADAFYCVRAEEDVLGALIPQSVEQQAYSARALQKYWTLVRHHVRNPGQQVIELVTVSQHRQSAGDIEAQIAELLPRIITLEK